MSTFKRISRLKLYSKEIKLHLFLVIVNEKVRRYHIHPSIGGDPMWRNDLVYTSSYVGHSYFLVLFDHGNFNFMVSFLIEKSQTQDEINKINIYTKYNTL